MSAIVAVAAAAGVVAVGPTPPALAATPPDQLTGTGTTASAVTTSWADGLLGADNKTVVAPRDQASPLAFMYPDFQNLRISVNQTENLVHQSIQVTWSGSTPTVGAGNFFANFLQIMQCYGDATSGPDPEDCEFGSNEKIGPSGTRGGSIDSRVVTPCVAESAPSTTNPPGTADGLLASFGCDTKEPVDPSHVDPFSSSRDYVPFIPVGTNTKIYDDEANGGPDQALSNEFGPDTTNEVPAATTGSDGTGQQIFQTYTGVEAPGLGCGAVEANGAPRDCWLVIVPRGEFKANGFHVDTNGTNNQDNSVILTDSPLSASNWAQRIQIHLGFDPAKINCPIGSADERNTVGSGLVARAVFSWQLALNAAADCKTLYSFTETPEPTDTTQLQDPSGGSAGLAFTTIPIGSEAARINGSGSPPTLPPLVYAPVTASAITFGFNVNQTGTSDGSKTSGYISTPIKLTPRLVAKALTQSYRQDLPDFDNAHPGPQWALNNPLSIVTDPEFRLLNPEISGTTGSINPIAPLLTEDRSGVNQQVWAWILADSSARNWLAGQADENGMMINPEYKDLQLQKAPIDSYPRADSTEFVAGVDETQNPPKQEIRTSLDLLPYINNFEEAASKVSTASNPEGAGWDPTKPAPDGSTGFWGNGGAESAGNTFMWAITDTSNLASFGLVPADLCDANGNNCVSPDTTTVTTALSTATADSIGLLHVDPAKPGGGGYPLVDVTYAAVRATLSPSSLVDFATLIAFAAGNGQTPGVLPGQLPPGYLPLPENLRDQSAAAAVALLAIAAHPSSSPTPTAPHTTPTTAAAGGSTVPAIPTTLPAVTPGAVTPGAVTPPAVAAVPSPGGPSMSQSAPTPAARSTPDTPIGAVRWVLLIVMIAGVAGAIGVPLIRVIGGRRLPPPWGHS